MQVCLALPLASLVFFGASFRRIGAVVAGFWPVVALLAKGILRADHGRFANRGEPTEAHLLQPLVRSCRFTRWPWCVIAAGGGVVESWRPATS